MPTVSVTELPRLTLGSKLASSVTYGPNTDYITEDKAPPPGALYAARMDETGKVTVLTSKSASLTPTHTYAGWPIPA